MRVVENPVTLVLYNHFPFSIPHWTINLSVPEYGPQLITILSASILLEFIMIGATLLRVGQTEDDDPPELEPELEPELDAHEELLTVVLLKVTAAVCAIALPFKVAPGPGKEIDAEAKTVPTIVVVPLNVAEESTFQNTLQA